MIPRAARRVLALMGVDALVSLPLFGGAESAVIARLIGQSIPVALLVLPVVTVLLAILSWWARGLIRLTWDGETQEARS